MWPLLNMLQILTSLNLLAVTMPINVLKKRNTIVSISNAQFIPKKVLYNTIVAPLLAHQDDKDSLLKDVLLVLVFFFLLGLVICILICIERRVLPKCLACQKIFDRIKAKLMFNLVIRTCIQTFLATILGAFCSLKTMDGSSKGAFDLALAIVIILYALSFTVFSIRFLLKKFDNLREPSFKQQYDSLYINVEYYDKRAILFTCFYLVRRMLIAIVICYCRSSIVLQVFLCDILSTLLLSFYIKVKPIAGLLNYIVEMVNETLILICF